MKIALALLAALAATPALAQEGRVSQSTLQLVGLGEMEVMSDDEGNDVRGMSSSAAASGSSLMFAVLLDPNNPGNFLVGADTNGGRGTAENAGLQILSQASNGAQGSSIAGQLSIQSGNPLVQTFLGNFAANAGNAANIGNAGFSFASGQ